MTAQTIKRAFERAIPKEKEYKVRRWAAANAYTLIFIVIMFVLTWILMVFLRVKESI